MFEGMPVEGLIGIAAFVGAILLLSLIHGINSAVQNAQASRREAARLVDHLNSLVASVEGKSKGPQGPGGSKGAAPRPVRRRKVVRAAPDAARTATKPGYGPRAMAGGR